MLGKKPLYFLQGPSLITAQPPRRTALLFFDSIPALPHKVSSGSVAYPYERLIPSLPLASRYHGALTLQVRENLVWALGYNVIALPLAAGAFLPCMGLMLSPAIAGAIMSCSSVAVVTNSLLLRKTLERELGPPS